MGQMMLFQSGSVRSAILRTINSKFLSHPRVRIPATRTLLHPQTSLIFQRPFCKSVSAPILKFAASASKTDLRRQRVPRHTSTIGFVNMALKPWADSPIPLISETGIKQRPDIPPDHSAVQCAQRMAVLHNLMLRAFNSSYNQCLGVRPGTEDARDFLQYNQVLYEHIKEHHDHEEEVIFPALSKLTSRQDVMDQNIEEHHELEEGLQQLQAYVYNTEPEAYDGEKLRSILDILAPPMKKHMHGEIATFLDLAAYDSAELEKLWAETSSKAAAVADKFRTSVMMLGSGDNTFLLDGKTISYPEFPFFVPYLAKYVLARRLAGAWRFNPSDFFGNPRPLARPNPTQGQESRL